MNRDNMTMQKYEVEKTDKMVKFNNLESISSHQNKINYFLELAYDEYKKGFKEHIIDGSSEGDNLNPYGQWYGNNGVPWCAIFVSYCAAKSGLISNTIPRYQNCKVGRDWYVKQDRYYTSESNYEPKAGDVFFFASSKNLSRIPHIGIIAAYDPDKKIIYTIEGNVGHKVSSRKFRLHTKQFKGYGSNGGVTNGVPIADAYWGKNESTQ